MRPQPAISVLLCPSALVFTHVSMRGWCSLAQGYSEEYIIDKFHAIDINRDMKLSFEEWDGDQCQTFTASKPPEKSFAVRMCCVMFGCASACARTLAVGIQFVRNCDYIGLRRVEGVCINDLHLQA